ncbi:MAG: hypothetical protein IJ660_04820, partial [Alphaproteobacteria bacterium]|nr:hypothetical protein [Alphaproteobacteria bacterium]
MKRLYYLCSACVLLCATIVQAHVFYPSTSATAAESIQKTNNSTPFLLTKSSLQTLSAVKIAAVHSLV